MRADSQLVLCVSYFYYLHHTHGKIDRTNTPPSNLAIRGTDNGSMLTTLSARRYGFQRYICNNHEKVFKCARKCLDHGFDSSFSDRRCQCRCYKVPSKAKFTTRWRRNATNYKKGTPTTRIPYWAAKNLPTTPKRTTTKRPETEDSDANNDEEVEEEQEEEEEEEEETLEDTNEVTEDTPDAYTNDVPLDAVTNDDVTGATDSDVTGATVDGVTGGDDDLAPTDDVDDLPPTGASDAPSDATDAG